MQHDVQELNRVLVEKLEEKMKVWLPQGMHLEQPRLSAIQNGFSVDKLCLCRPLRIDGVSSLAMVVSILLYFLCCYLLHQTANPSIYNAFCHSHERPAHQPAAFAQSPLKSQMYTGCSMEKDG